ncbi:hypothetical protein QAD02_003623 [Eretmocerus hayati]|uniref:Uncharacterized protein n=1 Tax=Eretmocerus hayati TaxID=131215 RepID=A0ACC2NPY2_9HYME|nr:hypothetical protein QAD02_003623 [Eretmocerus hayati]
MKIIERREAKKPIYELPGRSIMRDPAHMIKNMCSGDCFKNDNWVKKGFYLDSIDLAIKIDNSEEMSHLMGALSIIANSKSCTRGSKCFEETKSLSDEIRYFGVNERDDDGYITIVTYDYITQNFSDPSPQTLLHVTNMYNQSIRQCDNVSNAEMNPFFAQSL